MRVMNRRRWWDVAVVGVVLIVVPIAFAQATPTPGNVLAGLLAVALFFIAYVVFARPELSEAQPVWRYVLFVVCASVALFFGVASVPFLAMLQALVYPLVWVTAASRRPAVVASVVVSISVFFGFWLNLGPTSEGVSAAAITAGFSLALSLGLGLWIEGIANSAEERGRLVAQLEVAQTELEALASERGASAERERLARDIHDTLAQTLAGLVILAERAGRQSQDGQTDAAALTISTVEQVARDALAESRALVARTAAVHSEAVFGAAVERLAERFRTETGLAIDLHVAEVDADFDREAQVVALRCLQEALANVRKHADASRVEVRVEGGSGIRLTVSDDGAGFDPDEPRTGYGLDGMRDRLALAGGTLTIDAIPGRGTTLRIGIPFRSESTVLP